MLTTLPLLSLVTFLPLVGAGLILLLARGDEEAKAKMSRLIALITAGVTFAGTLAVFAAFDPAKGGFQLVEKLRWIEALNISYHRGVDGISLWFVMLSSALSIIAILAGFNVKERVRSFMIALLIMETVMIGVFTSLDLFLFYVFFEGVLIPMFLIIGMWGGKQRIYAATKFFLFTLLGSVLMLVGVFVLVLELGTSDMTVMIGSTIPQATALWLWLVFFASFAVKTPMWPLHTWLPYAHVEAPTAGSVLLAGVLLKMGGYGFIRVSLQILPEASQFYAPLMLGLSIVAIIYGSLVALVQPDMKKLVAYSSVAHMGYVTLGLFSGSVEGIEGAIMVMLSHGLVASALFVSVGVLYDRLHTREIERFGGVVFAMPRFAVLMMVLTLGAIGLPGTSGFVGEFLTVQSAWMYHWGVAGLAGVGVILGAAYMLWLYRRIFLGPLVKDDVRAMPDVNLREVFMLLSMVTLVVWIGLYPVSFRQIFDGDVRKVAERLVQVKEDAP